MNDPADVTHELEFFTYPRLVRNRPVGYDFGCFVDGQYWVLGNSRTRDLAVRGIQERYHPLRIIHEALPSPSKHKHVRETPP